MVTATSLKDQMAQKVKEISDIASAMSEEAASREPAQGEWCAKEVLSHLVGSETASFKAGLERFLNEDTPEMDIVPGQTHYEDSQRSSLSKADLLSRVEKEYGNIAEFLGSLSEAQLERKAHIPLAKDTPFGEYPTLGQWSGVIINYHLSGHVDQLRSLA